MSSSAGWSGAIEQPYGLLADEPIECGETAGERATRLQPVSQGHRASGRNLDPTDGFDPAEFAEFLEADDSPMPADAAFKERLRQQLWGMVRDNASAGALAPPRLGEWPRQPLANSSTERPR